jgi:uncharacterized membrane protein YeaQ/YmgE (transglycosylase-associated protein family)
MEFIVVLIILAVQGLIVGAFARLALPGKDPLSIPQTIALGLAGSFIAGLLAWLITDGMEGASFLAALVFSVLILYFVRRRRGGGLVSPSGDADGRR